MLSASVVIPCRNGERFLAAAIASVRAQTRAPCEIIVVDDGSTDASRAVALAAGVTSLSLGQPSGVSAARNHGIDASRGDVVAFLDADDMWDPDHLARLLGALERHPEADIAFGLVRVTGEPGSDLSFDRDVAAIIGMLGDGPEELGEWLLIANPLAQSATAARREALRSVGGYDASMRYAEDYDLWLRLAVHRRFICCHSFTCTYRVHPQQVSARRDAVPLFIEASWRARVRYLESIRLLGDTSREALGLTRVQQSWTRDIQEMSWMAEWKAVDALLRALVSLPDSEWRERSLRRWRRRRQAGPLWSIVRATWDAMPSTAQEVVRRLRRRAEDRALPVPPDRELSSP